MARATREETKTKVATVREARPLALGPFMGAVALSLNISAALVGEIMGVHEQTVSRWFLGRSPIAPSWSIKVAKVLAFLSWMYDCEWSPLYGNMRERKQQLAAAGKMYAALVKASKQR